MPEDWREFEKYVTSLYTLLGFTTTQDVLIGGQQIDIYAEKVLPGIGMVRLAIECKHRSGESPVSNSAVHEYLAFAESARLQGRITQAVIVTDSSFSRHAKEAARATTALSLLVVRELEDQLFDLNDAYHDYVKTYEDTRIFGSYIPVAGRVSRDFTPSRGDTVDDVEAFLANIVDSNTYSLAAVLGDFGTGKTTILERLKYRYARAYLQGQSTRLPFLIKLKEHHQYQDLDSLVSRSLRREFHREIPLRIFWRAAHEGRFICLFDGFDEMLPHSDRAARAEQFVILSRLLTSASCAILTCRTTYFVTRDEYRVALEPTIRAAAPIGRTGRVTRHSSAPTPIKEAYESLKSHLSGLFSDDHLVRPLTDVDPLTIDLAAFDDARIARYLMKHDHRFRAQSDGRFGHADVYQFLLKVYDLRDLMSRPILLDMIVETVLAGAIDITTEQVQFGPTSLYEIHTDMQFDRDWKKGEVRRQLLTREQRRDFAQAVAVSMYEKGTLEIDYSDIVRLVEMRKTDSGLEHVLRSASIDDVAADVQTCTFLSRNDEGKFRFAHKSFMEYFVARHLKADLTAAADPLFYTYLPKEVLYFLGGYAFLEPHVRSIARSRLPLAGEPHSKRIETLRRNMAAALLYSDQAHAGLNLGPWNIGDIDVVRTSFTGGQFDRTEFDRVTVTALTFRETDFQSVVFRDAELEDCTFLKSNGRIELANSTGRSVRVVEGQLILHSEHATLGDISSTNAELSLTGDWTVRAMNVQGGHVECHLSRGTLEDVFVNDANLTLTGGANATPLDTRRRSGIVADGAPLLRANVHIQSVNIRRCSIAAAHDIRITDAVIVDSLIQSVPNQQAVLSLTDSELIRVVLDGVSLSAHCLILDRLEGTLFRDCFLLGPVLSDDCYRTPGDKPHSFETTCGFAIIDGPLRDEHKIEGSEFGMIGSLLVIPKAQLVDSRAVAEELARRIGHSAPTPLASQKLSDWLGVLGSKA